jgi:hypothetical protein
MSTGFKKMICPLCNKEYQEGDNYCSNDGSRLEVVDAGDRSSSAEGQPLRREQMNVGDGK